MTNGVSLTDDFLLICIPIESLSIAAPISWNRHTKSNLTVDNVREFAKEIFNELRKEKENGDTLITDMLDRAVIRAVEAGAEGCVIADMTDYL